MNRNFDFDKAAHQNPYSVPEGFFPRQKNLILATANRQRIAARVRWIGAAASIAVAFTLTALVVTRTDNTALFSTEDMNIEQFIANASDAQLSSAEEIADAEMLFSTQSMYE